MVGNSQAPSCDSLPTLLNLRKKREKTLRETVLFLDMSKRLMETSKEGEQHSWMSPGRKAMVRDTRGVSHRNVETRGGLSS